MEVGSASWDPPVPVVSVLPAWYVPRVCALVAGALDVCLVAIFYLFGVVALPRAV